MRVAPAGAPASSLGGAAGGVAWRANAKATGKSSIETPPGSSRILFEARRIGLVRLARQVDGRHAQAGRAVGADLQHHVAALLTREQRVARPRRARHVAVV